MSNTTAINTNENLALRARAGAILNHDSLLEGKTEVPEGMHIGNLIANTAEYNTFKPLTKRVWVAGFKNPATGEFGMVAECAKPSPDNEIRIYAKSREANMPEEGNKYMLPDHIPAAGRSYRWECIWKLVYCVVKPKVTFDWACKIFELKHGADIVRPLIDAIDELMATPTPVDNLSGGNIFAYPTLLGGARVAARDGKLAEYFGSLEKGAAQSILDNVRTMTLIQMMVLREDAEMRAVVHHVVGYEIEKGEYRPGPHMEQALRDPFGDYMERLRNRASGLTMEIADRDAATPFVHPDDALLPIPEDTAPEGLPGGALADVRYFQSMTKSGFLMKRTKDARLHWAVLLSNEYSDAYYLDLAASIGLEDATIQEGESGKYLLMRPIERADLKQIANEAGKPFADDEPETVSEKTE